MMFTFHEAYLHSKKTSFFVLWISFQLLSRGQICCVSHIESGDVYCGSGSISKDMLVRITFDVICHLFTKDFKIACSNKLQRWRLFLLILPANKEPRSPITRIGDTVCLQISQHVFIHQVSSNLVEIKRTDPSGCFRQVRLMRGNYGNWGHCYHV